ncbi:hypothetical protein GDO86_004196 [Hymenochirus boettgeri]|uniref:Coiled-coil domain-containing protein 122 n=1 Tax=Hymenochirus boettgeri TaxID=247094 RepID=A0A8T2K470_9PIPI|nr:hypothetical protein GDO86_004196 [Hymenochirus boettgeri]
MADKQTQKTKLNERHKEIKSVLLETKETEKKIQHEEDTSENLIHLCGILKEQNHSIYAENIRLKFDLENQKEDFKAILSRNNMYRKRIEDNISHFSETENTFPVMIELGQKRDAVRILKEKKKEMIQDLHNPESTAIKQVQEDISYLCEELKELKQHITLKTKRYEEEKGKHVVLQKEIEVQKRRFDAILKRLQCQLYKAKLNRRQHQWNIGQMERTATELRQRLSTINALELPKNI